MLFLPIKNMRNFYSNLRFLSEYFLPGFVSTILLLAYYFYGNTTTPSLLIFLLIDFFIVLPLFSFIISGYKSSLVNFASIKKIFARQKCVPTLQYTYICILCLTWAILTFGLLKSFSEHLENHYFHWVPRWFTLTDIFIHQEKYSHALLVITWVVLLFGSVIIPTAEEVYFRGYLMTKTNHLKAWSPIVNTLLFSIYHLWSPWMIPVRFIATLPLYYMVWKKENIYIGIIVHCSLNIVGDVIMTFPLLFN